LVAFPLRRELEYQLARANCVRLSISLGYGRIATFHMAQSVCVSGNRDVTIGEADIYGADTGDRGVKDLRTLRDTTVTIAVWSQCGLALTALSV